MRGDPDRPRGEAARVAARVQALLREYHLDARPPDPSPPPAPDPLPWLDAALVVPDLGTAPAPLVVEGAARSPVPPAARAPGAEPGVVASRHAAPAGGAMSTGAMSDGAAWQVLPAGRRGAPAGGSVFAFASPEEIEAASEASPDPPAALPEPGVWQRVLGRVPVRLDPGRRTALAVGVAVLLAAVASGVWLLSNRPRAVPVAATSHPPASAPGAASSTPGPSSSPALVVVDVAGKVRRPGLYRLPAGSRVDDAIRAAGGARAGVDLSGLNLAAKLVDGQQIAVGTAGAPGGVAGTGGGSSATAGPVDLNTAGLEQLETLPGVGPVLAQHILDYRTQHRRFGSVDQLREVSGIGDVRFTQLRALVTV